MALALLPQNVTQHAQLLEAPPGGGEQRTPYLLILLESIWNGLESACRQEGLPDCKAVGLVVVVGEFPLGGAGSGVVGSVAERRWGKAYARLVAGRGGAKVREAR